MDTILTENLIAALIAAPKKTAHTTIQRLEPEDFDHWIHRTIFEALTQCSHADHSEPGSLIIQINRVLLASGHYQDQDNGLRAAVADLAGMQGHPEQLPMFTNELIEQRFRRAVTDHGHSLIGHAADSPLEDVDAVLRKVPELRRLRTRITPLTQPNIRLIKEEGAA